MVVPVRLVQAVAVVDNKGETAMIILSQDGERLVDCNTVIYCFVSEKHNICYETDGTMGIQMTIFYLGQYSTKSRCLEVIAEIADWQRYIQYPTQTYKMPKE